MTTPQPTDARAVLDQVRASASDYVKVAVVDTDGVLRGKYLDKAKFLSAAEGDGFGFCDVVFGWDSADECYDNGTFTGWRSGYPDGSVVVDVSTHRRIPWENDRDLFLGDFVGQGSNATYDVCPRRLLKGIVDRLAEHGYLGMVGMEFEWFNYRETSASVTEKDFRGLTPLTPGMFGYSILRQSQNQEFFEALLAELRAFGVVLEGLHTETGPGVYEAAISYSTAVEAADRAVLFKSGAKEIGQRFGIMATFMARVDTTLPGSSGHAHQSLWDADGTRNLFAAADEPAGMSPLFRHYLAGILDALPDCLPLLAPTVNSYKRLVDGFWAPTHPTWGLDNRTVAARVISTSPTATRLELRVPGADVNPYFAVAFGLAAGLRGIEQELELQPATVGSGYHDTSVERLPRNLRSATERMAASPIARELFGDGFVDHFCATREWEWRQFEDAVTDWETRRYFEII